MTADTGIRLESAGAEAPGSFSVTIEFTFVSPRYPAIALVK